MIVLLVMWDGGGNVNPFLALAGLLAARGHQVRAVATARLRARLEPAGLEVVGAPEGWLPGVTDVLAVLDRHPSDVVVVDYMLTDALCAAERSDLPTVALVHTLYRALLREGAPSPMEMAGSIDALNGVRASLDLPPIARYADLLTALDLVMVTAPRELDAPGPVPPNVVYAGALLEEPGADVGWQPPPGDGPLVVVCVGTAGNPDVESELLGRILDALGGLPVRGFVTVADYIDRHRLAAPANVAVTGYVRHAAVLPHADLLVTHAGLGSVVAALAHGVPMVCLPLDREQPDNARAVARLGAGIVLDPAVSVDELQDAVAQRLESHPRVQLAPDPQPVIDRLEQLSTANRS